MFDGLKLWVDLIPSLNRVVHSVLTSGCFNKMFHIVSISVCNVEFSDNDSM